jgi:hypothetical protein
MTLKRLNVVKNETDPQKIAYLKKLGFGEVKAPPAPKKAPPKKDGA